MAHNLLLPIIGRWPTETKKRKTCSRKGNFLNVYFASILKFWSSTLNLNWDPYERQKRCRLAAVVYTFNRSLLVRMLKLYFYKTRNPSYSWGRANSQQNVASGWFALISSVKRRWVVHLFPWKKTYRSLSTDVFESRTSTGSRDFSSLMCFSPF